MIPKVDGDATPLEQRPLCVFPVDYRIWASAFMIQQKKWFRFWVPDWVYSAGGGRSSVEAWYTTALGIGDVLASAVYFHVHFLVAYGTKSFVTVDRFFFLDRVLSSLACLLGFGMRFFEYHAHVRLYCKLAA